MESTSELCESITLSNGLYESCPIEHQNFHIRILKVWPGRIGEHIFCDLDPCELGKQPPFTALSYAWGENDVNHIVMVNRRPIPVRRNLYAALQYLRHPTLPVLLWVDAIRINQNSLRERNHQVHQMARIYGNAEVVIAWIGEPAMQSELAIRFISSFISTPDQIDRIDPSNIEKEHELWNALESLWSRPYWRRVWVVQELSKAQLSYFQCGYSQMTRESLALLTTCIRKEGLITGKSDIQKVRRLLRLSTKEQEWNPAELLWESAELKSTDTRDRIYGMLGLMTNNYSRHIVPDYTMDFETLAAQITRTYVSVENDLNILCNFKRFNPQRSLPSWVVDFASRDPSLWSGCYLASANRPANAALQGNILQVRAIVIGKVNIILGPLGSPDRQTTPSNSPTFSSFYSNPFVLEEVERLCSTALQQRYPSENLQSRENRFWNIVAGPRFFEATNTKKVPRTCRQIWDSAVAAENRFDLSENTMDCTLYFSFVFRRLLGRCIFATSTGHVGLGPSDLRMGDLVCVLYGCRMCMVLRPDGACFKIVGPAYVDGAMGGEYVRAYETGGPGSPEQVRLSIV